MNNDIFVYEDGTWSREPPTRTRYLVYKIGAGLYYLKSRGIGVEKG